MSGPFAFAASFGQRRLWLLEHLHPGRPVYHVNMRLELVGVLEAAVLERALQVLIRRHAVLRTSFTVREGEVVQLVQPDAAVELDLVDVSSLAEREQAAACDREAAAAASKPFDLERGPLLRACLLRRSQHRHELLLIVHHIVFDATSSTVFGRDLLRTYGGLVDGVPPGLPALPLQYVDFTARQRRAVAGERVRGQLEYWRARLAGLPALRLPGDRPRPALPTFAGGIVEFEWDAMLAGRVRTLAGQERATVFIVGLAAFAAVLSRLSGQDDLAVGVPVAGRSELHLQDLVGFFVNTLVVRIDLSGDPPFRTLLLRVRQAVLEALDNQDAPLEMVVDELRPERALGQGPLFQVAFNLLGEMDLRDAMEESGLRVTGGQYGNGTAKHDLGLEMVDGGDRLRGRLEYSADLFDEATAARLVRSLERLVIRALDAPDRRLCALDVMEPDEVRRLLALTAAPSANAEPLLVHTLVETWARRVPDAPAVAGDGRELTYDGLDRRANQLAHHLRRLDVGPERRVGVLLPRTPEAIVAMLAVLKAGGGYVPLDPDLPAARLRLMVEDAGLSVTLTRSELAAVLPETARLLCLDLEGSAIETEPDTAPGSGVRPSNVAYVLFTSGSTGRPKGVVVEHRQLCAYVTGAIERLGLGPWAYALTQPLTFDASCTTVYGALCSGGCLHILSPAQAGDPELVCRYFRDHAIDYLKATPSYLAAIGSGHEMGDVEPRRLLVVGGEASTWEWLRTLAGTAACKVVSHYGPTETTVGVTTVEVSAAGDSFIGTPIGRPLPGTCLYVLDGALVPRPEGMPGELCVGGELVSRGYLGQPGQTAERFLPDPYSARPGARLYRTGDRCRLRTAGVLEFLGRIDDQVKVRGVRIEPAEVEAALRRHPSVGQAVVVASPGPSGQRLVAYVVPSGPPAAAEELRQHLRGLLPDAMLPAAFVVLDALPLTASGKVDRAALPSPPPERPGSQPRRSLSPTETALARIWAEVLGRTVGADDNFFALGGDSLATIRIVSRARQSGLVFTSRDVFQHQTLAGVAAVTRSPAGADQAPVTGEVPLTPLQLESLASPLLDRGRFTSGVQVRAAASLDHDLLEHALQCLVRHHDALRLRMDQGTDGSWRQWIEAPDATPLVEWVKGEGIALDEVTRPAVDLTAGPILRAACRGRDLILVCHHFAVDHLSWEILLQDLSLAYERLRNGLEADLPARTTSFKAWSEALGELAASPVARTHLAGWTGGLDGGWQSLPLRSRTWSGSPRIRWLELEAAETERLEEVGSASGTQVHEMLLAALGGALARWARIDRALVELEHHGRVDVPAVDLSRTVGWFACAHPVLLETDLASAPHERLRQLQERLRSIPDGGIWYGLLRHRCPDPDVRDRLTAIGSPQIGFVLLRQPHGDAGGVFAGSAWDVLQRQTGRRPLHVDAVLAGGRLRVGFAHDPAVLDEAWVEGLMAAFGAELRGLIAKVGAAGRRPAAADFPEAGLTQHELDELLAGIGADWSEETE